MSITQEQKVTVAGASATTSTSATLLSAPTVGNTLIAVANGGEAITFPDTWTRATQATANSFTYIYGKVVDAADTATLTVTHASAFVQLVLFEYSGISWVDKTQTGGNTLLSTSGVTGNTATTTIANCLLVGEIGLNALTAFSEQSFSGWTNSFTEEADLWASGSDTALGVASRIVSATGAYGTGASWVTTSAYSSAIAAFAEAVDPPVLQHSSLQGYGGTVWVPMPVKRWDGTEWDIHTIERWNGTEWV